jgi:hypothetical protein
VAPHFLGVGARVAVVGATQTPTVESPPPSRPLARPRHLPMEWGGKKPPQSVVVHAAFSVAAPLAGTVRVQAG